jgi:hypothetical protein
MCIIKVMIIYRYIYGVYVLRPIIISRPIAVGLVYRIGYKILCPLESVDQLLMVSLTRHSIDYKK